ncbi:hypothetical protein ANO14919_081900 [Xylariales sp. No.14919]|nr:hypothetical protein ANO14919_081900 [Xylariales sp. No.14919]
MGGGKNGDICAIKEGDTYSVSTEHAEGSEGNRILRTIPLR